MYKLFIDTHGEEVLVAFAKNDEVISKKVESVSHSTVLLPLIDEMLKQNNIELKEIEKIIVVNGPGSFTGIRIGLTVAKTLSYCLNIPINTVSSLKCYLLSSDDENIISVIEDTKGYYVGSMDSEIYTDSLEEYKNKKIVKNEINVLKVIKYFDDKKPINVHSVKANYVKVIEALK